MLGSQALHFFGVNIDPTAATPPAGAALLPLSIFSHSFQVLHGVDLAKAAFLALPAPLVSQVVDPPVVKYSPSTLSDGNVSGPGSPPAGLGTIATQGTFISDGRSYRSATLFLFPLLYLPHRTRAGGDVLLYAVMRLLNSAGGQTDRQYSFWRVKVDDGTARAIVPWTSNLNVSTAISNMVVLGASLRHVLWKINAGGQTTIALTDTTNGQSKTLVQVPTGSGPDTAFLARNWEVLRPDLLYLLDDKDASVSNKFLRGWTPAAGGR